MSKLYTAESVCKGHPDKLCDLISDSILDECLKADRNARVACEVLATKGHIFIAGEITCEGKINVRKVACNVLLAVGYNPLKFFIHSHVHKQSGDIAGGVNSALETRGKKTDDIFASIGAGDQGTVYGYACDENWRRLPLPVVLANSICEDLDRAMRFKHIDGIGPDGKAQVTVEYGDDGKPERIKTVIVSVQHKENKDPEDLRRDIITEILYPLFSRFKLNSDPEILINPSGRFVEGGPAADTGLTGRKIIADAYGGLAAHGGGAFSGKDPTKVDRSGAYMARYIAKNIVEAGLAKKCQVAISYAIGKAEPVAVEVDTFGTGFVSDDILCKVITDVFDLRPAAIISLLNLRRQCYADICCYGHFDGVNGAWENTDKTQELKEAVKKYEDNH